MATSDTAPLGETEYQKIMDGLASAESAIKQAELAERAGLDVGTRLSTARQNRERLLKMKHTYFPNR